MSRIRADKFVNRAATGAPELTYGAQVVTGYGITGAGGINISGVVTATGGWGGTLAISDTTDSTSSTTGALTVAGGVGIAKSLFVGNNVTIGGTVTYEDVTNVDSVGLITAQTGVKVTAGGIDITAGGLKVTAGVTTFSNEVTTAGGVDINGGLEIAGITTLGQSRFTAVSEQLARIDGNTASIVYNSSGQNIGLCTNATGDITLNVTGIPVDSNFDNQVLTFSLVVQQTGTGRTCNAVKLNGVTKTVRWSGNVPGTAGVAGTIRGYDIFNFTGINTVGSATSAANYEVLGLVNGDFRTHA